MERRFIAQDGMDFTPEDINNIESFVERSLDHIVFDGLGGRARYAGFATGKTGNLTIEAQPGRLYTGGEVYVREDAFQHDFTPQLPVATRKICTLYTSKSIGSSEAAPREFLIDVENETTEPRVVSTEQHRVARLQVAQGVEAADPSPPPLGTGAIAVAHVALTTLGVETVTMVEDNRLISADGLLSRVIANEEFRGQIAPQVKSLAADISSLREGQEALVGTEDYARTLLRLADVEAAAGVPTDAVDSFSDLLLDESGSDPDFSGYDARVEEGIRLPIDAETLTALSLKNPLDANAHLTPNGALLPSFDNDLRFSTGAATGEVQVNAYSYQNHAIVQKKAARIRWRHGPFRARSSAFTFLRGGRVDLLARIFSKHGEDLTASGTGLDRLLRKHRALRRPVHWFDKSEYTYWDQVTEDDTVPGFQVAETFLQANDMWLSAIGLTFTKLAAAGQVTVAICETVDGRPDLDAVIGQVTMDRGDLTVEGETIVPFEPTFLQGGKRYALVLITAADHFIGTVAGSQFPAGTFFYVLDGQYQQGDATRDIAFNLYACRFRAARAEIPLAEIQLVGGVADIDILAEAIEPGSCRITYEVQIAGIWHPLTEGDSSPLTPLGGLVALLPLRVVMTGTPDVMPMLQLTGSQLRASRPKNAFTWVGDVRTLPAPSDDITVRWRLESFADADHTFTPTILTGGSFDTEESADSTTDIELEDGSIERVAVFDLGGAVSAFRPKGVGTVASVLAPFHVGQRRDYAV